MIDVRQARLYRGIMTLAYYRPLASNFLITLTPSEVAERCLVTAPLRLQWLECSFPVTGVDRSSPPASAPNPQPSDGHQPDLSLGTLETGNRPLTQPYALLLGYRS
jgi:hypothetical protein